MQGQVGRWVQVLGLDLDLGLGVVGVCLGLLSLSSASGAIGPALPQWLPFQQPRPNPGICPTFPQADRDIRRTGRLCGASSW